MGCGYKKLTSALEASAVLDLIKDAWMKKSESTLFAWVSKVVRATIEGLGINKNQNSLQFLPGAIIAPFMQNAESGPTLRHLINRMERAEYESEWE